MLLAAGVVGVFIALAIHARNRAAAVLAANAADTAAVFDDEIDEDHAFDGTYGVADAQAGVADAQAGITETQAGTVEAPAVSSAVADDDTSAEPTEGTTRA
jgi:hypothetical protein